MFREVAVGIDGSTASRFALVWAADAVRRVRGTLTLVHIASTAGRSGAETDAIVSTELGFARDLVPGSPVSVEIRAGDTVRALAEAAAAFDLLAIGTHKTGFLRGRAFGSVGPRLASVVTIPLAVIPAPTGRLRRGIVVGVDEGLRSLPAIRLAATEAAAAGTELTLIHAQPAHGQSRVGDALELVGATFPDLAVHTRAVAGDVSEALINAAAAAECLYIGGSDPDGGSLGPMGYDVLLNISGPTILVPLERETVSVTH